MFWIIVFAIILVIATGVVIAILQAKYGKVGQMESAGDVEGVIALLQDDHASLSERSDAAYCLGRTDDARKVDVLVGVLEREAHLLLKEKAGHGANLFIAAARALGMSKDPRTIEPLISALEKCRKANQYVMGEAVANALANVNDCRAVEPLVNLVVCRPVTTSAGNDDLRAYTQVTSMEQAAGAAISSIRDTQAVEPLISAFRHVDLTVSSACTKALVAIGSSTVDPLINALESQNRNVRKQAAEVLARIGDTQAIAPLEAMQQDSDKAIRKAASKALKKLYREIREKDI